MVLGKLSVPGRPTIRIRAYCACSRCGWGLFGLFYSYLFGVVGWGDGAR